jgi:hypothetical protein
MKTWAEERRRQMEMVGATELAEMFDLVVKMCALEEKLSSNRDNPVDLRSISQLGDEPESGLELAGACA